MKIRMMLTFVILCSFKTSFGQQNLVWNNWKDLIGNWIGEGSGKPGQGGGTFSFTPDLDNYILVRKSHSEYLSTEGKPQIHEDVMIIYLDINNNPSKSIYFDNEGHTINYDITYKDKTIIMTSEKIPGRPVFRLSYSMHDKKTGKTFLRYPRTVRILHHIFRETAKRLFENAIHFTDFDFGLHTEKYNHLRIGYVKVMESMQWLLFKHSSFS